MGRMESGWKTVRGQTVRQGKLTLIGLAVVLVPVVVVLKSIEHAHKLLTHAASTVAPGLEIVGGVGIAAVILVAIFVACWVVGWLVSRTERGQLLMAWEKSKLLGRTPLQLQKEVKKVHALQAGQATATSPKAAQPALAYVAGGWQPGVIVEEQSEGWASVFLPDIPSVATGRLYLLHEDKLLRLDVPLDTYREQLISSGHGSGDWLQTLAEARPGAGETGP